jgi:hypothetical protein
MSPAEDSTVHLSEEQLVLHFYGDAENVEALELHLRECAACRHRLEVLKGALASIGASAALHPPERGEGYGNAVWLRLEPRLPVRGLGWLSGWRQWLAPRRLAWSGALAVLLLAAFLAGRFTQTLEPAGTAGAGDSRAVRERILLVAVGEHLERSQLVLIELTNAAPAAAVDISSEQQRARELVDSNRLYRQTALEAGETGVADVLDQLERVLVEIANSPSELSGPELERIRKRLEAQGILFKVRALGSQVRERSSPAALSPDRPRMML